MVSSGHSPIIQHFLKYQRLWGIALFLVWGVVNILVLATSIIMEDGRDGVDLPIWMPFCWEISSISVILVLIPVVIFVSDKYLSSLSYQKQVISHLLMSIPFSLLHVVGMVALRKLCYWFAGREYIFGDWPYELLYEYRKDLQAYISIALAIAGYKFIVRRLQGEASLISEGESEPEPNLNNSAPERLLIKKLGKEFLVNVDEIEWVEAAGNYANLHIGTGLYPMRITMAKLEKMLPEKDFVRIHRSYIVNLGNVKSLLPLETGDYEVRLADDTRLSLSRRYRDNFKSLV